MFDWNKKPQHNNRSAKEQILEQLYQENVDVRRGVRSQPHPSYPPFSYRQNNSTFWVFISIVTFAVFYTAVIITQWQLPFDHSIVLDDAARAKHNQNDSLKTALHTQNNSKNIQTTQNEVLPQGQVKNAQLDDAIYKLHLTPSPLSRETIVENQKKAVDHLESLSSPNVPLAHLFGLGVSTIVIDPGHGGKDPGTSGTLGTQEKDIALGIAKSLRDRLKVRGKYNVLMTRETDEFLSLSQRVVFANANNADLFISIHINYFPNDRVNFVETYYFGPNADKKVEELALRENADSHYNFGEFKEMVKKVSDTMKFQESRELAQSVQDSLFTHVHKVNRKIKDHGIKPAPFVVLLGIDAPSILTEVASINHKQEEQRLKSPAYRDRIAKFLEKGIVNYLNKTTTSGSGGGPNGEEKENLAHAKKQHKKQYQEDKHSSPKKPWQ